MSILIGHTDFHNKEVCKGKYTMKRPIVDILQDLRTILQELGIQVSQPDLDPLVHTICRSLWVRDISINIDNNLILLPAHAPGRRDEWMTHPEAEAEAEYGHPIMPEAPENMEGGDVIQDGDRIIIGLGKRTNMAGVQWLKMWLQDAGLHKEIILVQHCALHLDGCLMVLPGGELYYSTQYIYDLPPVLHTYYNVHTVEQYLRNGADANLSTNVLVLGNNLITTDQAKFSRLRSHWKKLGYNVHEIKYGNLWRYKGGIRCLSQWIRTNQKIK